MRSRLILWLFGALSLILLVGDVVAGPVNATVTTNSTIIVPPAGVRVAPDWVANTAYVAGATAKSQGLVYICVTAGTSHATVALGGMGRVTDGTCVWLSCMSQSRQGVVVVNDGAATVYVTTGWTAALYSGGRLNSSGGAFSSISTPVYQGAVSAITTSASNNVTVLEW